MFGSLIVLWSKFLHNLKNLYTSQWNTNESICPYNALVTYKCRNHETIIQEDEILPMIIMFQITFMNNICLPTYLLIGQIFPKASSLAGFCRIVRTKWMELSRFDRERRKREYAAIRESILSKAQNVNQCMQSLSSSFHKV